jgi:hypothetical protein
MPVPTQSPTQSPTSTPTAPPQAPQACEISLWVDSAFGGKQKKVFADLCTFGYVYQLWSESAGSVLRYSTQNKNIVVAPSYDPAMPLTDLFRFYFYRKPLTTSDFSYLKIRNDVAVVDAQEDRILGDFVYANTLDGELWGMGGSGDKIVSFFYVRQLPGSANKPRSTTSNNPIPRVAIEADVSSCRSDGCESSKGNGKRYFVTVRNGIALVVGTTATYDNLPSDFVFYIAESFIN